MSVITKILNRRDEKIIRQMRLLDNSFVEVGVHDDAGAYAEFVTVAQVAFWNHFGTKNIPARPFITSAIDQDKFKFFKIQDQALNDVVAGKITVRKALDKLGFRVTNSIQKRIRTSQQWAVPLSIATIQEKIAGGSLRGPVPLIDTGLLLRSITWKTTVRVTPGELVLK